jgi:hypothetical protein
VERTACVFCGATDRRISKEHVWPKWLRKHIELGEGPPVGRSRRHSRGEQVLDHVEWREAPIDWQVKAPCKPCNEDWMNDLEGEAREVLPPMLADTRVVLDAVQQHTLAKWGTLRVLMGQHGHPPGKRAVPEGSYHAFYRSRALPSGAQVWVGRYSGAGPWPTDYRHVELFISSPDHREPARPNAYVVGFTVGYVAFLYWGHEIEDGPEIDLDGIAPYFVPVWPVTGPVVWPPPGLIGENGLELEAAIRRLPIDFGPG